MANNINPFQLMMLTINAFTEKMKITGLLTGKDYCETPTLAYMKAFGNILKSQASPKIEFDIRLKKRCTYALIQRLASYHFPFSYRISLSDVIINWIIFLSV